MHVVPNGVPTSIFRPAEPSLNGHDGALRLLFVGNWRDSRKGLPVLLDACRELQRLGLRYALDVIGEGTPSEEQRSVPGVTFLGSVASEAILAGKYQSCDVFVAPATGQESFGIVLVEAMACARPVVCSDIRGFRDVVDPQGACLVPPGDAAALARALADLAVFKERRASMGVRNRVRAEEFDWDRVASRVRAVYVEALAG
jgi:phosphatidylinositol alpha-mannosyltransferase